MLVDSHCHLDYFSTEELPGVIARAAEAGVGEMVTIGTRLAQAPWQKQVAEENPGVWAAIGIHPHNAGEGDLPSVAELVALTDHPKVVAVGESGLDYFYDKAPRDRQAENFRIHIAAARETGLPLVIHARDADDDVAEILRDETGKGAFPFLLHCFSSTRALAETGLELGGYLSFSGMLTFPKSQTIRDIAKDVPKDRLLVETDSPYLAPVPHRGKKCEPGWTAHTAKMLGELHGLSPDGIAELTTANFRRLFSRTA